MKLNLIEKAISSLSPSWGMKRLKMKALDSYYGSSTVRRQLSTYHVSKKDADSDLLFDLPRLRERSRDLDRNNPIATGAINTNCTSIFGDGLKMHSRVDRDVLNMSDEEIDELENTIEREWRLFSGSLDCGLSRNMNFDDTLELAFRSMLVNGDVFINLPRVSRKNQPYSLRLQPIEADRVTNPNNVSDNDKIRGGVEFDNNNAPIGYHIQTTHPGATYTTNKNSWKFYPAYGRNTGLKNIIHLYKPRRPGQSRGEPYLAPVIESLKMLGRYTEAEIMAAVISGMFTVFIKTESDDFFDSMEPTEEIGGSSSDKDYKLGPGAMLGLGTNESIETANPGRPNTAFDPFVMSILRQIGAALELPFEFLIKHFTASFSASKAAINEAYKAFRSRRKWMIEHYCNVVFEIFFYEAVVKGRINAPGFLTDPTLRAAYLSNEWIGSAPSQLDELKSINAAEKRMNLKLTSRSYEAAQLNGTNWEHTMKQIKKEEKQFPAPIIENNTGAINDENT